MERRKDTALMLHCVALCCSYKNQMTMHVFLSVDCEVVLSSSDSIGNDAQRASTANNLVLNSFICISKVKIEMNSCVGYLSRMRAIDVPKGAANPKGTAIFSLSLLLLLSSWRHLLFRFYLEGMLIEWLFASR